MLESVSQEPLEKSHSNSRRVYSSLRNIAAPEFRIPDGLKPDTRLKMDGIEFLSVLPESSFPVAFLDPQYRGVLDKMKYGNEGKRESRRFTLKPMSESTIGEFIAQIDRILLPTGHLFLWVDKFHLCQGVRPWLDGTKLDIVDLISWNKNNMGMGYRTRRTTEYCLVLQKYPRRAKGVWTTHDIRDSWTEKVLKRKHPHVKPIELQSELLAAVTDEGNFVIDPAAGSFSVMAAARITGRRFLGCDING